MREAWGLKKDHTRQMWTLSLHILGIRIKLWGSQKGFTGNKQMRSPVHLDSPPRCCSPHCRTQPAFLCQMLVITALLASHWVWGHFPPQEHRRSRQSPAHYTRSSHLPHPFHWQGTRYHVVQNTAHDQKLRQFLLARVIFVHWWWEPLNLILAHKIGVYLLWAHFLSSIHRDG